MALVFDNSNHQLKLIDENYNNLNILNIADKLIYLTRVCELKWQQPLTDFLPFFKNNSLIVRVADHNYFGKIKICLEINTQDNFIYFNANLILKNKQRQIDYNKTSSDPVNPVYQLAMMAIGKEYLKKHLRNLNQKHSISSYNIINCASTLLSTNTNNIVYLNF